jgi:hypothetical protein
VNGWVDAKVSLSDAFDDIRDLRKRSLLRHVLLHRYEGGFIYLGLQDVRCSNSDNKEMKDGISDIFSPSS